MNRITPHSLLPLPHVYEQTHRGERALDVWSRLLLDRIVFLGTEVTSEVANAIIAQLLFLESEDPEKTIHLYINSPGGDVAAGLAIYDTMHYINAPVATLCAGRAMSMGAVLLAGGEPGQRAALPHSSILIHQPLGGARGQASDIEIHAREIVRLRKLLNGILVKHTGQDEERVRVDSDRDYYLTAEEALEYGIIDRIVERREDQE
ncbi:MAG: ATP-dependent Clp protease proteolytic subunit [Rickettsiales bacterium]|nr:ATP-dependent Clp protease proteolytic subunit [Rickettsiales bacterium]|tara:strand:+ start:1808 stop:2425 length:618 start_codon:yes stop_codon:yes gene_type:complete